MECIKSYSCIPASGISDGDYPGKRVDKFILLPCTQLMRTEEFQTIAHSIITKDSGYGANAFHMPVEVLVKLSKTCRPDMIVSKMNPYLFSNFRSVAQLLKFFVKRSIVKIPMIEIGRHREKSPFKVVLFYEVVCFCREIRIMEEVK